MHDLEEDIKAAPWLVEKIRGSKIYAQNLYAAMCNTRFIKNDIWPILKDEDWTCSWRYAGGLIAEIRGEGDYMDWYCSGIHDGEQITPPEDVQYLTDDEQAMYHERLRDRAPARSYVKESCVVNEVREDLLKLGWVVSRD